MNRSLQRTAVIFLSASLLLTACSQVPEQPAEETAVTEPEPTEPVTQEKEAEPIAPYRHPLTGTPSQLQLTDRPAVVMVENSPAARPQSGLHKADIVYEILAEGDITRFVAVYHSQTVEKIGPVRSIRPYFVELGAGLDAVIVHAGWSQDAMNVISKNRLNHLDQVYGDHKYYWREKSRKAPHNLYTSTEMIKEGAKDKKFRESWTDPVLAFAESVEAFSNEGQAVASVTIPYINGYTAGYEYDAGPGLYRRSMKGKPHTDAESGEQITAANVLICETDHRILDNAGRRNVDVFGPDKGYLLQRGKLREITWENKNGVIRAYAGSVELPLLPGQTWVHVVPSLSKVDVGGEAAGVAG
ncbi:DUF3048 domain-containing protein [Paenibacillus alkalitolerans]|uniref:DUF3048 domain-containing protein n=1 Tax=Paenibacillus alkalitolerans TaxID=2799335 RepID=UPI0018F2D3BB|nr:DUF3048 domain-containing protein [Paenibacillus alkalitolerans]